jgi:carboxyl-terminal processing protease
MEIKNRKVDAILPVIIALALVVGILVGFGFKKAKVPVSNGTSLGLLFYRSPNKVDQVLELILSSYVDSLAPAKIEEDAIRGMLKDLDPHSQYIPASELTAMNEPIEGNFSGIGISFDVMNDTVVVVNTVSEGPSERVGIMPGDRIVMVDDSLVAGRRMLSGDIVRMLKGKTGTTVKIGIYRRGAGELLSFTVTRDKIPLWSVDAAYMIEPGTGFIRVNKFSKTTLQEFTDAIRQLSESGMERLIIDLRDNPGGIIDAATGMAEMFLPEGSLIVYTEGNGRKRRNYYSKSRGACADMELVLLINEASASASEIVAGALQDNDRGVIVGRRSFGKGLVQEPHTLLDGSAVRLTVARYYTPTGRCIQKPYGQNRNSYKNELSERYLHGEMLQADSMYVNDTLKYVTPGGKVVYGGGGIMPDIFVPIDTACYTTYYEQIIRRNIAYRFAFDYTDSRRKALNEYADYRLLEADLYRKNILKDFIRYAAKNGIREDRDALKLAGPVIENILIACIVRNIFGDKAYHAVINGKDNAVQKGIEVLSNENRTGF